MQVKAKIVDENNEPLVGASVVVLNAVGQPVSNGDFVVGDSSDFDGNFVINNAAISSLATLLRISFIGYKTTVIPVASIAATSGIIKMYVDSTSLTNTDVYGKPKNKFSLWWLIPIAIGTAIAVSKKEEKQTSKKLKK